jgi:hypothetical protein
VLYHLFYTTAWKEKAVKAYLSANNAGTFDGFPTKNTPGHNPNGRAFPRMPLYSANFTVLNVDGSVSAISGTSLSAAMASAVSTVISLANQKLLESGYHVVGLLLCEPNDPLDGGEQHGGLP